MAMSKPLQHPNIITTEELIVPDLTASPEVDLLDALTTSEPIVIDGEEFLDVTFGDPLDELEAIPFDDNLALYMEDTELAALASELIEEYEGDVASRHDWIQTYVDGLDLLGMKIEERTQPWPGACGVVHPMLAEALVKFQAEVMMSTFPAAGPVRTEVIGKETTEKKARAQRVQKDMNYMLTERMTEYRDEHERMLWGLGLSGNSFKKVYYNPGKDRPTSMYVTSEDLVVPYGASNIQDAPRITHVMRKTGNEVKRLQYSGFYRDVDLGEPSDTLDEVERKIAQSQGFEATIDNRHRLLEMHVELDLEAFPHLGGDGLPSGIEVPYVVTIDKDTATVLAIRRNWEEGDANTQARQHFVHYGYVPAFGFYNFGLIHLVGAFASSGTSLLRQLVDSGTLANIPGGFKSRAMRVRGEDTPISPGEWRDVDVPAGTIRDNILPLPYKEPSQTLMALMGVIIEEGRRFANTADLQISDMSSESPVGTTLAILERALKAMSAVQARIHYAMKRELGLLKEIIRAYTPPEYDYEPEAEGRFAKYEDYEDVAVIPVSDPNASTLAQRIVQYQAVLQLAQGAPHLYNLPLLHRQMLDVIGVPDSHKLVPMEEDQKPSDPVSENQNILSGKPVKAFAAQDHEAHILVHMSAMKDPKILQLLENHPNAEAAHGAMMAHISEHIGFQYRAEIEAQLGFNLPPNKDEAGEDLPMDPEVEARLAPLMAKAAQRLLQNNQTEVAQQEAQQQAEDPLMQLQQAELQIKQAEVQRKQAKDAMDAEAKERQQKLEAAKILAHNDLEREKLASQNKYDAVKTAAAMRDNREKQIIKAGVDAVTQMSNRTNKGGE